MTEILERYPGEENTEARVARIDVGFSASLWDLDAADQGAVGIYVFRLDRFPDAEQRARDKARALVDPHGSEVRVLTEEQYLAIHGASALDIGDSAMHKLPGVRESNRRRLLALQQTKDERLLKRREKLRARYAAEVAAGRVRPPTRFERLKQIANGHPDNESVQAARRILKRSGIEWRHD